MAPQATSNTAEAPTASLSSSASSTPATTTYGFLPRVASLPLVNSALEVAKNYYDVTKTRYEVVGKLEQGVHNLAPRVLEATPHPAHVAISKGLQVVDYVALSGLVVLERHVPLITQPTPAVIGSGKRFVDDNLVTPVSSAITQVRSISVQDFVKLANSVKELIYYVIATADGYVVSIRQSAITLLKKDDARLQKLLEGYAAQFQAALRGALDLLESAAPESVRDTYHTVFDILSRSFATFYAQVSFLSKEVVDPIARKALEAWKVSFAFFISSAQIAFNAAFGSKQIKKGEDKSANSAPQASKE